MPNHLCAEGEEVIISNGQRITNQLDANLATAVSSLSYFINDIKMTSADVQTLQNSARDSLAAAKQQTLHVKGKLLERERKRGQRGVQQKGRKRTPGRPQGGADELSEEKALSVAAISEATCSESA